MLISSEQLGSCTSIDLPPNVVNHPLLLLFRYWQCHPIARRDLPGTVLRFLRWQIGTRLLGMPVVFPWIGTTSLVVERGMTQG